jgi:hypothetical protein
MTDVTDQVENERANTFIRDFTHYSKQIHQTAIEKGWWAEDRNNGELLALIHSEISESLEALRKDNPPDDKLPEFSSAEVELADAVIRIMDMACARKWELGKAIIAKLNFNNTRSFKHGGKKF